MAAPLDADEFDRWREEAGRALEAARVQDRAAIHNWSCFMAEQAAQLGVKAALHGMGVGAWGHDLVQLTAHLRTSAGDAWDPGLDGAVRRLSRHYIPARYPDAHPGGSAGLHYGADDSEEAIRDARELLDAIDRFWSELIAEGDDA